MRRARRAVLSFIRTNNVTDVFAAATVGSLVQIPSEYATLIDGAMRGGTNVSALVGDARWVYDSGGAASVAQYVANFNAAHPNDPFTAVHADVEPWTLTDWTTNQAADMQGYLWVLDDLGKSSGLPVEADIPAWLDTVAVTPVGEAPTTLDVAVGQRTDRLTIMSYRNSGNGMLAAAQAEYDHLTATVHKPIRLAAETRSSTEGSTISYYGSTLSYMYPELAQVDAAHPETPYLGIAIHDYAGWAAMPAS